MQRAALHVSSLDWSYELLDVEPEALPAAVDGLRDHAVAGANVTTPYKSTVVELVDALAAEAAACGAVNTIVNDAGRLHGLNTDLSALERARRDVGLEGAPFRSVVLGAGGAARAAAMVFGPDAAVICRRPEVASFAPRTASWGSFDAASLLRRADVVINATPLGRNGEEVVERQDLPRLAVIDLVYSKQETPLVRSARVAGLRAVDGWSLLVWQGAAAFSAWTGRAAPESVMREAALS